MRFIVRLMAVLIVLFPFALSAQVKLIKGKIVDKKLNEPLVGAIVKTDEQTGTITNENGDFQIRIQPGMTVLTVSYLGYESQRIDLSEDVTDLGTIDMQVSATSLDEIMVTGSLLNYKTDFKGSNYRVSPKVIQNINPISTEEVLQKIPGINTIGDMGLSNRPNISIRGSWGRRSNKILLMEDGSPAAPAPYMAPGAYYNPVSDRIQAIEVYKGADMLRYGPNNMYGAVNYITALPPQQPELRVKLVGGQRGYQTGLFSYGGTWGNLGSLVEAVYKDFDGFQNNSSVKILNLNAKLFARLSDNQSLYFKISGQYEKNHASLSAITPFTFVADPFQNPFDADIFTMRRYGLDIIHKWVLNPKLELTSKIYASDFERDWWRQVTTVLPAAQVKAYLGDAIYEDRYSYMASKDLGDEDYVRVGKLTNGRESTTDSRWIFTVSGIQETFHANWTSWGHVQPLEVGLKLHRETYSDVLLQADSSRWARRGRTQTDRDYHLWSGSGYVRQEFVFGSFSLTPIVRFEHVEMYRQDLLALSQNPDLTSTHSGRMINTYSILMPGSTAAFKLAHGEFYGSIYEGFIAPSDVFGFLVERDGVVTDAQLGDIINMKPELSVNTELGWRGNLLADQLEGQITYFNNTVRNFYVGGRNEVFEELGRVNIQGLELGLSQKLVTAGPHSLRLFLNSTLLHSRILGGTLVDQDLFSQVIHSKATKQEFVNKVNSHRAAYDLYTTDAAGNAQLMTQDQFTTDDFDAITKARLRFGKHYIQHADLPYTPAFNLSSGLDYDLANLSAGASVHYVGNQYAEFQNFKSESADGAVGRIDHYTTLDTYLNYDFKIGQKVNMRFFANGKNVTNNIYRASRLNRATSGIFPGGFRQIIFGLNCRI